MTFIGSIDPSFTAARWSSFPDYVGKSLRHALLTRRSWHGDSFVDLEVIDMEKEYSCYWCSTCSLGGAEFRLIHVWGDCGPNVFVCDACLDRDEPPDSPNNRQRYAKMLVNLRLLPEPGLDSCVRIIAAFAAANVK